MGIVVTAKKRLFTKSFKHGLNTRDREKKLNKVFVGAHALLLFKLLDVDLNTNSHYVLGVAVDRKTTYVIQDKNLRLVYVLVISKSKRDEK